MITQSQYLQAQSDSNSVAIQQIPGKYISEINKKINKYGTRLVSKTEKTLIKLSRWEKRIQVLLQKANPEIADRLFSNKEMTFTGVLEKFQKGESITASYKAQYDHYTNSVSSSLKYLEKNKEQLDEKYLSPLKTAVIKINRLEDEQKNNEAIQVFIKERKKQLIQQSIKYIGKSKFLKKINKESYYYAESIANYKDIFSDPKKAEEAAMKILNQLPAFRKFAQQNSPLASLFAMPSSFPSIVPGGAVPVVNGLASRTSFQQYMAANVPSAANINPVQIIQANLPDISKAIDQFKKNGGGENELPDFTPNSQRSKTFFQRLEYDMDLQFGKSASSFPSTADIGFKIGYKLNDKSSAGIGLTYKAGMGKGWNHVSFTSEGLGFRIYVRWKLKKGFDIQGGSEWNYLTRIHKIEELKNMDSWQQAALLGIRKNYNVKKKVKGNIQFLYDFLYAQHIPGGQPFVFRMGYGF